MSILQAPQGVNTINQDPFASEVYKPAPIQAPQALNREQARSEMDGAIQISTGVQSRLQSNASQFVNGLFTIAPEVNTGTITTEGIKQNFSQKMQTIHNLGQEAVKTTTKLGNAMLQQSLKDMENSDSSLNQHIAKNMLALRTEVDKLNPSASGIDFAANVVKNKKLFGFIPIPQDTATAIKAYFAKYSSSEQTIQVILDGLEAGKQTLIKNNRELEEDKIKSWEALSSLRNDLYFAELVKQELEQKLQHEKQSGTLPPDLEAIIREDVLLPIMQKITDLNTQTAVTINGYLAYDLIKNTNKELINGVDRCKNTTVTALRIAVTIASQLYQQKLVLNAVEAVNETTENLLLSSSEMLKQQSSAIYKGSISATIKPEILQQTFNNLLETMNNVNQFKNDALESLKAQNNVISNLNNEAMQLTDNARKEKTNQFLNA